MKIELKYDGKNYYNPSFKLFWNNEKDNFGIGIKYNESVSYDFIAKDILENFEEFKIKQKSFYYYTKENVYVFNLGEEIELIPFNKKFSHCVVLLDKDDKIIKNQYVGTETIRNENFI